MTRPMQVVKALENIRKGNLAFEAMLPASLYDATVAQVGFDPAVRRAVPVSPPTKRDRHRANRITQQVWNSIVYNRDTGVATVPAMVPLDVPTDELPQLQVKE